MSAKLKTALAMAVILCVLLAGWRLRASEHEPSSAAAAEPMALASIGAGSAVEAGFDSAPPTASREVLPTLASSVEPLEPVLLRGRVLDLDARPVAGIGLWSFAEHSRSSADLEHRSPEATTDADGEFELPMPTGNAVQVIASDTRYVTVLAADLWAGIPSARPLVIVAPRVRLAGIVLDLDGSPLAGAHVWSEVSVDLRRGFPVIVDSCLELGGRTHATDELGRFELDDAAVGASTLKAWAPGYEELEVPVPASSRADVVLTLSRSSEDVIVVHGRVVDPLGDPVARAWVSFQNLCTRSGDDGTFTLPITKSRDWPKLTAQGNGAFARETAEIVAVSPGHLPARRVFSDPAELGALVQRDELLELTLGGEPPSIRGHVHDDQGRPLEGVDVWPLDATSTAHLPGAMDDGSYGTSVEALMKGGMEAERVRSAVDGSFVLGGLFERRYHLAALHRPTMRWAKVDADAGTGTAELDVEFVLASAETCQQVHGRVLGLDGEPLAGVQVFPLVEDERAGERFFPLAGGLYAWGERQVTGPDGRFDFAALSPGVSAFQAGNQEIAFADVLWNGDPEPVIRLSRRCRFQVWRGAVEADGLRVLDEAGEALELTCTRGSITSCGMAFPLEGDRSSQISVSELARTVVLTAGGREVARRSFTPDPAALVVLRF